MKPELNLNLNIQTICNKCKNNLNTYIKQLPTAKSNDVNVVIEAEICKHCLEEEKLKVIKNNGNN